ncbi:hypothetical protein QFC22_003366 [Naganishia vaughanmartiniae]|uniref:Uncharacterized protein n=1 Tax=Naganishia vaughanmartiniae TaxID=1424756 RepID=A0ACC2X896_9TREE|nr:hypothetical protein QFC22_003366 [Naganishia vaughanmartiniae]
MSNDMVPCLAFALSGLARKQGSLDDVVRMPGLVQVERFQTFRNSPADTYGLDSTGNATTHEPTHDNTQLIAWVMDSRCRIRVFFDVEATNRTEKMTGERVTSYLRSLVYLKEYKFVILPPSHAASHPKKDYYKSSHRNRPELVLHVYDWQKYIGSSDDPLYHEEAEYLLSNFLSYSLNGIDGRVPKGYGTTADEVICRKQENEALGFVRSEWERSQSIDPLEHATSVEESIEKHLLEAPYRHVLMSMLRSLEPDEEKVVDNIKGEPLHRRKMLDARANRPCPDVVFGINPLEELDVMEIAQVLLDNAVNIIPDTPPRAKSPPPKAEKVPRQVPRKKACRKSTGRKLPHARRSVSTAAAPPEILAPQALLTQLVFTQNLPLESTFEVDDHSPRRDSGSPEPAGARYITLEKRKAILKQTSQPYNRHISLPDTSTPNDADITSSRSSNVGKDGRATGFHQEALNRRVQANVKESHTLTEQLRRGSESERERDIRMHHGSSETSKSAGKKRESNESEVIQRPAPPPPPPDISSSQAMTSQIPKSPQQAQPSATASQREAPSPIPLPSSQQATRNDREEEDSDMDQDNLQSALRRNRQSSYHYLFELDDDEDGLYEFEVAGSRTLV